MQTTLTTSKRWVIKVGSAVLTQDGNCIDEVFIAELVSQIQKLKEQGVECILVSSGAIACGLHRLGIDKRPQKVSELQAAAAVGQADLVHLYQQIFRQHSTHIAQILITHADIANRERYLNIKNTLTSLLKNGIVPIINENDTVATQEICFSDNDHLASLVVNLLQADMLVILTDQNGLYDKDPRKHGNAQLVEKADADDESLLEMASGGSSVGRGGMLTKLRAAHTANHAGASTVITNGAKKNVLLRLRQGELLGTFLQANKRISSKKHWLLSQNKVHGVIVLDQGAVNALRKERKSLLPSGIRRVEEEFNRGELIECVDENSTEIARGLSNYSAAEIRSIKGAKTTKIQDILGYILEEEVIHRDNLVIIE